MAMSQVIVVAVMGMTYATMGTAEVSRATAVKFNTVCTRCHEGECSGRVSFSSGVAATRSHVLRYLPSSSSLPVGRTRKSAQLQ